MVEIKFCGLTRAVDAAVAAELGAAYAGVIFAGGPRNLDVRRASDVFAGLAGAATRRVGVFGDQSAAEIARIAAALAVDVVQLHSHGDTERIETVRAAWKGEVWIVAGVRPDTPTDLAAKVAGADGLLLDTVTSGRSGGTGVPFDWSAVAPALAPVRGRIRIVLAGGLRPTNVAEAVRVLKPDVVDVSSGVETSPGIKDPVLMRAFAAAARSREE